MRVLLALLAIALLVGCTVKDEGAVINIGDRTFVAEIADTDQERQVGLMDRDSLPEGRGMLFIFPDQAMREFWMKDTKIPLDIIFFDKNWRITSIVYNMTPCAQDPCPTYSSIRPAKYALEVNQGEVLAKGVKNGMSARTSLPK